MRSFIFKRIVALMLVIMMIASMIPFQVFALDDSETHSEDGTTEGIENKPFEETVRIKQVKEDISKVLNKYLGALVASGAEPRADGEDIQPRHEGLQNACYLPSIKKENYRPIRPLTYK